MGALPKNKITRVERGKRRAGNTPKLLKDTNQKPGLHKRGFVASLFRLVGLQAQGAAQVTPAQEAKEKDEKKAKASTASQAGTSAMAMGRSARPRSGGTVKQARVTQHKG